MEIQAENLHVSFSAKEILKGVSLAAGRKEFVGIIGPNGSGKSTLLKCIYRVLKARKGRRLSGRTVELQAMSVKSSAKKMAVVSQHNYYNFDFSVREVVLMGPLSSQKNPGAG